MEESIPAQTSTTHDSIDQVHDQLRPAIERDDGATVRQLLLQFMPIHPSLLKWQGRQIGVPPLLVVAARTGAVAALAALLEHRANYKSFPVTKGDSARPVYTPLNAACQAAQTSTVRYLRVLDLDPP